MWVCAAGWGSAAWAQDLHFSQFYHHPLQLNPALAGVFGGHQRITAAYRNQWMSVPVPYLTFSGGYDQKINFPGLKTGAFGLGVLFNYDRAGDANLSWAQLGLSLSYTQKLAESLFLTAGAQVQGGQRAFDPQRLYFDEQYNGDTFDPTLPNYESFLRTSTVYLDYSAGINGLFQSPLSRTQAQAGLAYRHINRPSISFFGVSNIRLMPLTTAYITGAVQVAEPLDWTLAVMGQFQGAAREWVMASGVRYHLKQEQGRAIAVGLAGAYRWGDAVIPSVELYVHNWRLGLSYDVNTSPFRVATLRSGGPEVTLQYILYKVQPPDTFKACPIF